VGGATTIRTSRIESHADYLLSQSSVKNVFIRGSVVRYVHLPGSAVDTALLEDGLFITFLFPWINC
jgi:hypothetical protein